MVNTPNSVPRGMKMQLYARYYQAPGVVSSPGKEAAAQDDANRQGPADQNQHGGDDRKQRPHQP